MFCSQCGNRVPDGSRFCGLCGTKMSVEVETPTIQNKPTAMSNSDVDTAFDWSGVRNESHRRYVRDVVSPWSTTGLEEEPEPVIEPKKEEPEQRSRTMSFIDMLKKEREEKALEEKALEEETAAASAVVEERFVEARTTPSVYVPPVYDDVSSPVITPFDAPMYTITESQHYSAPRDTRLEMEIPSVDSIEIPRKTQPIEYTDIAEEEYQNPYDGTHRNSYNSPYGRRAYRNPYTETSQEMQARPSQDYVEANKARLNAELSQILDTDVNRPAPASAPAQSYEPAAQSSGTYVNRYTDSVDTDMYLSMDERRIPRATAPKSHAAPIYEPPMYQESASAYSAPTHEAPRQAASSVGSNTAEIEALKARLAELMGASMTEQVVMPEPEIVEPIVEPVVVEAAPEVAQPVYEQFGEEKEAAVEDYVAPQPEPVVKPIAEPIAETVVEPVVEPIAEPVSEPVVAEELPVAEEELPLIDPTPEVEEELSLINDVVEEEPEAETTAPEEKTATDAMSAQDLERSLFGEVTEEEIQAEETKKIDKFYTLYRKNEEFQKLLDEEYNKLKNESDEVPTVSAVLAESSKPTEPENMQIADAYDSTVKNKTVSTKTSQMKPVAAEVFDDDEEPSKGGTALTVIAVIVAILLVVLLAVILVLNFAPDSAIAVQIDSIIETITSYFSGVEISGRLLL